MPIYCPKCSALIADATMIACPSCGVVAPSSGRWPSDPLLGQVVDNGKYKVDKLLGSGGFGRVYAVHHTMLPDQRFALKVLRPLEMNDQDPEAGFLQEVQVLMGLNHPNIVRCHDVGRLEDGALFLRMELAGGQDLHHLVWRGGVLGPDRVARIGAQIAAALAAAHEQRVLHRDLKPDNVLIMERDEVRLIDFGVAKILGGAGAQEQLSRVIGTPDYMAPEQFTPGLRVDGRLDVYQLGAVLHFALTGKSPYKTMDMENVHQGVLALYSQQQAQRGLGGPRPSAHRGELSERAPSLDALISQMLSTEAELRPDAAQVAASLRALAQEPVESQIVPMSEAMLTSERPAAPLSLLDTAHLPHTVISAETPSETPPERSSSETPSARLMPSETPSARLTPSVRSTRSTIAVVRADRRVAVLPFENGGDADDDYLAEGLAEDLIDLLSATRGLRVRARGVSAAAYQRGVDPREAGRDLDVEQVICGVLQRHGSRLRIRVRLIDVAEGDQLWGRRFDIDPEGAVALAEEIAGHITESLTLPPPALALAPPNAVIDLYLRGRHELRHNWHGALDGACDLFAQALVLAPEDPLVQSNAAVARARRAFLDDKYQFEDIQEARRLANSALEGAPGRVEPHFALALIAFTVSKPTEAVYHARQALAISEAYAEAHDLLGRILLETGPLEEGMEHLQTALTLDPGLASARQDLIRAHALLGQWDQADRMLDILLLEKSPALQLTLFSVVRYAIWRGEVADIDPEALDGQRIADGTRLFLHASRTGKVIEDLWRAMMRLMTLTINARRKVILCQFLCELAVFCGNIDEGLNLIEVAQASGLTDRVWLERCPALDPLRVHPRFEASRLKVGALMAG